jgi:hypothetical protein
MHSISNLAPSDYETPPFPSLYWPYPPSSGVGSYLYYSHDIWRFTLLWTLIMFAVFYLAAAALAVCTHLWKGPSSWKYLWIIPLVYAAVAGVEALLAGSIVGSMYGGFQMISCYKEG